jgi:dienelactone hydrolase
MRPALAAIAAILASLAFVPAAGAQGLVEEPLHIPAPQAEPEGLEALLVRPAGPGRHPLVLVNHGGARDVEDRSTLTPEQWLPELEFFARRGFTAVAVMRRGYGTSGGVWAEGYGPCTHPNYRASVAAAVSDLRVAIADLSQRPDVDPSRILSVGTSSGGLATVGLTADPPPGLVAAISFAGARGSPSSDEVCSPEELIATFKALGARSRVPMLWIFAQNDHFFGPQLAERLWHAFTVGGGKAEFIETPPFGSDGHFLFSPEGMPIWAPLVDKYLEERGLKLLPQPLPLPTPAALPMPAGLSPEGQQAFRRFLLGAPHKAFAAAPDGAFGWRTGRRTTEEARRGAMDNCGDRGAIDCRVIAVDDRLEPTAAGSRSD